MKKRMFKWITNHNLFINESKTYIKQSIGKNGS